MAIQQPTIALVYDKVSVTHGGAERVLQALHKTFPHAPLYTTIATPAAESWSSQFSLRTSFLQKLKFIPNSYRVLVPFFPVAFESFDLSSFDMIISITSGEAKGILTKPHQLHMCYLLTPPRYLYSHSREYLLHPLVRLWPLSWMAKQVQTYLRWWDQVAATRPDVIIPISNLVAHRVNAAYRRICEPVMYPPIAEEAQTTELPVPRHFFLSVSRLVPYKRVDLSIGACKALQQTAIIVGDGMERERLIRTAGKNAVVRRTAETTHEFLAQNKDKRAAILFLGKVSEKELASLYSHADALLMPGIEDYGITAMEAAQYGTPTIMHHTSGVAELLTSPRLAIHLSDLTKDAMIEAIELLQHRSFRSGDLQKVAKNHTFSYFQEQFGKRVIALWQAHNRAKE